ncbi:hypothetical protein DZF79_30960 [Vibrio parahaemolyticus]|nr:hypothetical protein [Vibrio parahaemolyticus]
MKFFEKYKLVLAGIILGFYLMAVVFSYTVEQSKNIVEVLNLLGGLISSAGAIAAIFTLIYVINEKRQEEQNKQISYVNYIMVQFFNQTYVTLDYRNKVFKDYTQGDAEHCINLTMPRYSIDYLQAIDLEKSAFLIGSYDPNLFSKISHCRSNTASVTEYVDHRIKYQLNEIVKPCKDIVGVEGFSLDSVEKEVGVIPVYSLLTATDRILGQVDTLVGDLHKTHTLLYQEMKKKFPNEKFIKPYELT